MWSGAAVVAVCLSIDALSTSEQNSGVSKHREDRTRGNKKGLGCFVFIPPGQNDPPWHADVVEMASIVPPTMANGTLMLWRWQASSR